jgi:hypothetical protein
MVEENPEVRDRAAPVLKCKPADIDAICAARKG